MQVIFGLVYERSWLDIGRANLSQRFSIIPANQLDIANFYPLSSTGICKLQRLQCLVQFQIVLNELTSFTSYISTAWSLQYMCTM